MMKVIGLTWLSKGAKEAELVISDGIYECIVFCHPCDASVGELLKEPLHAFILKDLMISKDQCYFISPIASGRLAHKCVAKLIDKDEGLVRVGDISILLDERVPPGAKVGDFIEFTCMRIDLW